MEIMKIIKIIYKIINIMKPINNDAIPQTKVNKEIVEKTSAVIKY